MWFRKEKKTDAAGWPPVEPLDSLRRVAAESGLRIDKLRLSIPLAVEGGTPAIRLGPRLEVTVNDGSGHAVWRVDSMAALFRGDRLPPSEEALGHYPIAYLPFFYGIESHVRLFCAFGRRPTDAEFLELYTQMRRRPDGKSLGPLHDIIWQSAALALGLRPWSEAEYAAVFGQLARSARHFKVGPTSRNYIAYVTETLGHAQVGATEA